MMSPPWDTISAVYPTLLSSSLPEAAAGETLTNLTVLAVSSSRCWPVLQVHEDEDEYGDNCFVGRDTRL
jgi:hypothetical protein